MSTIVLLPVAVAVVGALVYALAAPDSKFGELGRVAYLDGLLVSLLVYMQHVIKF